MKIPAFDREEVRHLVTLPAGASNPELLADVLAGMLSLPPETLRIRIEPERVVEWGSGPIKQPARWLLSTDTPSESILVEYWAGSDQAEVRRTRPNLWLHLARLHMSIGTGPTWIVLSDVMALGLVFLGCSGFLLWGKLHGSPKRLLLIVTGGLLFVGAIGWGAG